MRRVFAFLRRNLFEMLSYKSAFLFDFAALFFQILTFFFIGKLIPEETMPGLFRSGGYFPFVLVGITFSLYQTTAMQSFSGALAREQESGTLEMILVTTAPGVLLCAGFFWNFLFTTFRVLLYLGLGFFINSRAFPSINLPAFCAVIFLTLVSLSGFGLFSAGYFLRHKRGDPVSFFMNGVSKFFSGVFFPIAVLPVWAQPFSSALPLTYSLKAIRGVLLEGFGLGEIWVELWALALFSSVLLPAGVLYFFWSYRQTRKEGSLGYQ